MFTGLIKEIAQVVSYSNNILTLKSSYSPNIGDSIAVNGACLTVVSKGEQMFSVELADETRNVIAIENIKNKVHIEPAMQLQDRFEGHIVQGHIDCIGTISRIQALQNGTDFYINVDKSHLAFMVPKGSVTIDGVSLTINETNKDGFRLTIIPHTMKNTLLSSYKIGRRVNIETDLFARYIANILNHQKNSVNWDQIDHIQALY